MPMAGVSLKWDETEISRKTKTKNRDREIRRGVCVCVSMCV